MRNKLPDVFSQQVNKELLGHTDVKVTLNTYCDVFEIKDEEIAQCNDYLFDKGLNFMA